MKFKLIWTKKSWDDYEAIQNSNDSGLKKQVDKALARLSTNLKHPALNSHQFHSLKNPYDSSKPVWESYVQNRTPGAYRIFWVYGPETGEITILAITPHP